MKPIPKLTVSKAAETYEISRNTLNSWIQKGVIQANRASDAPRSPWEIDVASLEAHLAKPEVQQRAIPSDDSDEENLVEANHSDPGAEMPSLRDHHVAPTSKAKEPEESHHEPEPNEAKLGPGETAEPRRSSRTRSTKKHSRGGRKAPTYPVRITRQQLKDAIRRMSLDETLEMRNWLNKRLERKLNP